MFAITKAEPVVENSEYASNLKTNFNLTFQFFMLGIHGHLGFMRGNAHKKY